MGGSITIHMRTVGTAIIEPEMALCPTGYMPQLGAGLAGPHGTPNESASHQPHQVPPPITPGPAGAFGGPCQHIGKPASGVPTLLRTDRFGSKIKPYQPGTAMQRSPVYRRNCGEDSRPLPDPVRGFIRKHRKPDRSDVSAVLGAYPSAESYNGCPLYKLVNKGLYEDDEYIMQALGGYIHALRLAMKIKCLNDGKNVTHGVVYRNMSLTHAQIKEYKVGFRFLWPNFVSTSWRSDLPCFECKHGQTPVTFVIDLNGLGTTFALDMRRYSCFPEEREVLIYPFSGFEVLAVQEKFGSITIHMRTVGTAIIEPEMALCPTGSMPHL